MKRLVPSEGGEDLRPYGGRGTVLAFNYEGVLAPLRSDPRQARMRPSTRRLLVSVARHFPVAVLSGRARRDLERLLDGVPILEIHGNHGADASDPALAIRSQAQEWRQELEERLESIPGILVEDRGLSVAVHYRTSPDLALAAATIRRVAESLDGVRLLGGNRVLNVVPSASLGKDAVLREICERAGARRAIFVGCDESDEDVFRTRRSSAVLGVRVGKRSRSAASLYLRDQREIDGLLQMLAEEAVRSGSSPISRADRRSAAEIPAGGILASALGSDLADDFGDSPPPVGVL